MPVTPFHFGPGALLKAVAPGRVSLTAFCAAQVLIDVESGYHLFRGEWPVHRELHSMLLSTLAGVLAGLATWFVGRFLPPAADKLGRGETQLMSALIGGAIGGLSHPILDGVMHTDLRPFWPFSASNPFFERIDVGVLHLICAVAGGLGVLALKWRSSRG